MEPILIPPGFVDDALASLKRRRIPIEPVLRAVRVNEPDSALTPAQYGRLWLAIAKALDDEFFGLGTRPMRRGSFALLCYAVLHAGTLEKALRRMLRFMRVVLEDPHGELVVTGGLARIIIVPGKAEPSAFAFRTFWLIVLGVACWLIGRRLALTRIDISCSCPQSRPDYHQFFGVPVHYDQELTQLSFPAEFLRLPTIRSELSLRTFLHGCPGNLLIRYRHDAGWVTRIKSHLKSIPACDWPDFETLAKQLDTSPATLRRRLRAEGQSFVSLKDEMRSAIAQSLLQRSTLSVAEIGLNLGFAEPSAFHRAFRKWTGTSPGAFRRDSTEAEAVP